MKRIQDKVKDIVEVRPFRSIRDFTADPAETLSNYHFTDATADLMAKWLDGIAAVQPGQGAAFALAGYRGVGKSHFLATLGALAASPELRGRIAESHVEFSAQRLQRRHYPVSHLPPRYAWDAFGRVQGSRRQYISARQHRPARYI